jgi:hypothetical protein
MPKNRMEKNRYTVFSIFVKQILPCHCVGLVTNCKSKPAEGAAWRQHSLNRTTRVPSVHKKMPIKLYSNPADNYYVILIFSINSLEGQPE